MIVTFVRLSVGLGLVWMLVSRGSLDVHSLRPLARQVPIVAAALLLLFASVVITSARLSLLCRATGFHLSLATATRLALLGVFFSLFLPGAGGGDLVRIYYAVQQVPGQRAEVATTMVMDRACGAYAMILLPVLLAPFVLPTLEGIPLVNGLLLGGAVIAAGVPFVLWAGVRQGASLREWFAGNGRVNTLVTRVVETVRLLQAHPAAIVRAVVLSLFGHGLSLIIMLLLAQAVLPTGPDSRMVVLIPLAYLANSLPVTPGGLGVGEAALDGLFRLAALGGGAELLLAWRLLMLAPALVGLVVYIRGQRCWVESLEGRDAKLAVSRVVESPGVESPGVESPGVESPGVESPGVESAGVARDREPATPQGGARSTPPLVAERR